MDSHTDGDPQRHPSSKDAVTDADTDTDTGMVSLPPLSLTPPSSQAPSRPRSQPPPQQEDEQHDSHAGNDMAVEADRPSSARSSSPAKPHETASRDTDNSTVNVIHPPAPIDPIAADNADAEAAAAVLLPPSPSPSLSPSPSPSPSPVPAASSPSHSTPTSSSPATVSDEEELTSSARNQAESKLTSPKTPPSHALSSASPSASTSPSTPSPSHHDQFFISRHRLLPYLRSMLVSSQWLIFLSILTLLALFLDDARVAAAPPSWDQPIYIITFIVFLLFCLDVMLNCLATPSYIGSFLFYMDVLGTLSLLPDIPWIWLPLQGLAASDGMARATQLDAVWRMQRRVQARTGKEGVLAGLERLLRLVRLLRAGKIFEVVQRKIEERQRNTGSTGSRLKETGVGVGVSGKTESVGSSLSPLLGGASTSSPPHGPTTAAASSSSSSSSSTSPTLSSGSAGTDAATKPSQVSQHLSEQTTRKVVLLVLLMLFGIPLLQPHVESNSHAYAVEQLATLASRPDVMLGAYRGKDVYANPAMQQTYSASSPKRHPSNARFPDLTPSAQLAVNASLHSEIDWMLKFYSGECLHLRLEGSMVPPPRIECTSQRLAEHRASEVAAVEASIQPKEATSTATSTSTSTANTVPFSGIGGTHPSDCVGIFSLRALRRAEAASALVTTCVVLLLLMTGAALFSRNNHRMVVVPIERMMATIVALQANPLAKASLSTLDGSAAGGVGRGHGHGAGHGANGGMGGDLSAPETGMLERTLEKLTGLLQIGFGEAGSRMIQQCMNINADGVLDPLVDGRKMHALFGFCDIRRFTDVTECLKEEVMMYVNEIAAIVHAHVAECDGSPNKNIGDAFLLVWRLPTNLGWNAEWDQNHSMEQEQANLAGDDLFSMCELGQPSTFRLTPQQREAKRLLDAMHVTEKQETGIPLLTAAATAISSPSLATAAATGESKNGHESESKTAATDSALSAAAALLSSANATERRLFLDRARKAGASMPTPIRRPISPPIRAHVSILADKALISFLRIIVDIEGSEDVRRYATHPRIQAAMEGFRVQLGFGLHCGWAIEGPIGSRYKIDASYLSPHVNLSETLQDATKLYGTPLLFSGEFYALLSGYVKSFCRRVDVVHCPGRESPINLYTVDLHPLAIKDVLEGREPRKYFNQSEGGTNVEESGMSRDEESVSVNESSGWADDMSHMEMRMGPSAAVEIDGVGDHDLRLPHQSQPTSDEYADELMVVGGEIEHEDDIVVLDINMRNENLVEMEERPLAHRVSPASRGMGLSPDNDEDSEDREYGYDDEEDENDAADPSSICHRSRFIHPLFHNPYLNPLRRRFHTVDFLSSPSSSSSLSPAESGEVGERTLAQHSSPIAPWHLVRGFRLDAFQRPIPTRFFNLYEEGLDAFLQGEWKLAEKKLKDAARLYPQDRTSQVLLDVMKEKGGMAPSDWAGWHEI